MAVDVDVSGVDVVVDVDVGGDVVVVVDVDVGGDVVVAVDVNVSGDGGVAVDASISFTSIDISSNAVNIDGFSEGKKSASETILFLVNFSTVLDEYSLSPNFKVGRAVGTR